MLGIKILNDIDKTLDKLVNNANELSSIDLKSLSTEEFAVFENTQKNLLLHLFDLDKQFEEKKQQFKAFKRACEKPLKKSFTTFSKKQIAKKAPRTNRPKKKVL